MLIQTENNTTRIYSQICLYIYIYIYVYIHNAAHGLDLRVRVLADLQVGREHVLHEGRVPEDLLFDVCCSLFQNQTNI